MRHVIIGAGLAGAKAAQTLRDEGFDGDITLIGAEPELPYERPPLSKGLLLGATPRDQVYVHQPDWYAESSVEIRTATTVVDIDRTAHRITTDAGDVLPYDKLLLATGSSPRRLAVPGADLDGVLYLRTLADSDRVSGALRDGVHVVIVGAGWIGLEIAAAARTRGAHVTVVETASLPLLGVLGPDLAQVFADLHRDHGVSFRFGAQLSRFDGDTAVRTVSLADGIDLPADVVIVGVGARPNDDLAVRAGLDVGNGVVVDSQHRTSDPDIFAAGDVACAFHPTFRRHIRTEHWANALDGGPEAARAMLGLPVPPDRLPFFFTDQYDLGAEYAGFAAPGDADRLVFRGDRAGREFVAFWTRDGRVLAGMNVNVWDVSDDIQRLIRTRKPVGLGMLADDEVPLSEV
ncbi:3-phenylpropionate/trans-cinnamate dioxygenase ferredoxin reductase subunit [Hamadaea flava]|uniref:NAD(P)/FAD-dependent oxidoreductase n=1 Tax=Hamadaea flava TaxID=1742688 RepID=A0ABV8LY29_9ACTN|nr:FAD-dependent oxidoreductase [Hamadaea flava]MCP2329248.1 3-phenylpropionate/trans-cinnamate dioxygenase ferredoxin reductase subunit [Hamadaea flava]